MLRFAFLLLVLSFGGGAAGQNLAGISGVAVYRYAEPGELTKEIQLWGAVRNPGIYQVERGADLLTLLTLAGGPAVSTEDARTSRKTSVRVIRQPAGARTVVLDASLEELTSEPRPLPALEDGDLVTLTSEVSQRFTWRDALSITSSAASLAVLILRIVE